MLSKPVALRSSVSRKVDQLLEKQQLVMQIVQRDLAHARRLQESRNKHYYEQFIGKNLHAKRLAAARAGKYFRDYELDLKSKFLGARTREEQTFIKAFEKGLKSQREQVRDARKCVKERHDSIENEVCKELAAMEAQYPFINHQPKVIDTSNQVP